MSRVAYVTYRIEPDRPDPDIDIPFAVPALAAVGIDVDVLSWDDASADWSSYDLALLRSAWDYVPRFEEFMRWTRLVSTRTRLVPPLRVIEHNTDKSYLRDLAAVGVGVVPTHWVDPGQSLAALPWPRVVVKPAVSSGTRDTIVTSDLAEASDQVDRILASGRLVLVQPYIDAVDHEGEVSVVVIDGVPSHAVRKIPALSVGGYGDASETVAVTPDLAAAVQRILAAEPYTQGLPFVRVDVVRHDGEWLVMELEMTEPLLFLGYAEGAPERFAAAVAGALGSPVRTRVE